MPAIAQSSNSTITIVTNTEFYSVITDSANKVIFGIKRDFTYTGLEPKQAIQTIIDVLASISNA